MPLPADAIALDNQPAQGQGQLPADAIALDQQTSAAESKPSLKEQFKDEAQGFQNLVEASGKGMAELTTGKSLQDREMAAFTPEIKPNTSRPYDANVTAASNPIARTAQIGAAAAGGMQGQQADMLTSPIGLAAGVAEGVGAAAKGAGDASARLYDWMVKLPNKSFRFSKDPLTVLQKEKVTGNSITDLAQNFQDRLGQRNQELDQAIKGSDKTVDLGKTFDVHLDDASSKLTGSLRDRTSDMNSLATMKENLTKKYGDLDNMPVQDAIKLKRQLADDYPFTKENSTDVVANAAHKMYHSINDAVEEAEPNIADLNQRVSGLIDISNAAKNRMIIESRQNPLGLIQSLIGIGTATGVGAAAHGVEGAGMGLAASLMAKAATSPAILSRVAKGLSMLSEGERIGLYKAVPSFMDVAQAAHEANPQEFNMAMAGKVSKGGSVEGEYIPPTQKGLPSPPETLKGPPGTPIVNAPPKDYLQQRENIHPLNNPQGVAQFEPSANTGSPEPIPMKGATERATTDLSTPPKTAAANGPLKPNLRAQVDMSKGGANNAGKANTAAIATTAGVGTAAVAGNAEARKKVPVTDKGLLYAILGEAEGGGISGQRAVASALRNNGDLNAAHGAKAIIEKNGDFYRTYKDGRPNRLIPKFVVNTALQAVQDSHKHDFANGANHWFSRSDLTQAGVRKMIKSMQYKLNQGDNFFYKEGK